MKRPVWYYFFIPGGVWSHNPASAVVALVNPVVLVAGEAAILIAIHRWIARRDLDSMIVAVGFLSQYLPWLLNPKGLEFSFYFFPSVMCLAPALALVVFRGVGSWRRWAAVGVPLLAAATFLFFLPVLAGGIGVDAKGYYARMWLKSWI
jgi:dolichyl-phosphate-mannose--protein O-mannosyl transferase